MGEETPSAFGAQLVAELRRLLRSTVGLSFSAIQALETADREEVGRILRREITGLTYAQIQMIRHESPEALAQWLIDKARARGGGAAMAFFSK
jgi:hypothetical protein